VTIGEIFDRAVVAVVHRWKVAVLGAGASALVDIATRATSHVTNLWLGLILIGVVVDSYVFALQIRQFAPPASGRVEELTWRLSATAFRRSLLALILCTIFDGVVLVGTLAIGVAAYRASGLTFIGVAVVASAVVPPVLLISTIAYGVVVLTSVHLREALPFAYARVRDELRRSWLLGSATLLVALVPPLLIEYLLRFADVAFGMNWLLLTAPLLNAPATVYATALSAVVARDCLDRSSSHFA
jgi:hypothetical protein